MVNGDSVNQNHLRPSDIPQPQPKKVETVEKPMPAKPKQKISSSPKKEKIQSLNHLDDEALYEKLTGEKPSAPSDLAPLKVVEDKESKPMGKLTKADQMKTYPTTPQDELDLHGKTALEAEKEIRLFILRAKRQSMRLVRIITGKGLHSREGQSVLRDVAESKAIELKGEGLVFSHKWEKGSGALLIYLK